MSGEPSVRHDEGAPRAILVTGASSGLGAGLCRAFAGSGVILGLVARDEARLDALGVELAGRGAQIWQRALDVADPEATQRAVRDFAGEAGRLDIVIANAGVGQGPAAERFDVERAGRIVRTNALGVTNTLLAAAPIMKEAGHGTLVGMASLAGYGALPGSSTYSASKAFVMTFIDGLRLELAGSGVHAVALCPGFVRTPLTDQNDFSMPWMLECDDACRRMKRAIEARRRRYSFPWQLHALSRCIPLLPDWALLSLVGRARSAGEE